MAAGYGFYVTSAGWDLLGRIVAQALQQNQTPVVQFQRVRFGDGIIPSGENPALMTDLVNYVADGSSSPVRVVVTIGDGGAASGCILSFVLEYRSNFRLEGEDAYPGATYPADVTTAKLLTEWSVDALDAENGTVVSMIRGYFGDNPRPIVPFLGASLDVARFPVSLALDEELYAEFTFPSGVFVTHPELEQRVDDSLRAHNEAPFGPETHPPYWAAIAWLQRQLDEANSYPFEADFVNLSNGHVNSGFFDPNLHALVTTF